MTGRPAGRRLRDDRGSVSLLFVVVALGLLAWSAWSSTVAARPAPPPRPTTSPAPRPARGAGRRPRRGPRGARPPRRPHPGRSCGPRLPGPPQGSTGTVSIAPGGRRLTVTTTRHLHPRPARPRSGSGPCRSPGPPPPTWSPSKEAIRDHPHPARPRRPDRPRRPALIGWPVALLALTGAVAEWLPDLSDPAASARPARTPAGCSCSSSWRWAGSPGRSGRSPCSWRSPPRSAACPPPTSAGCSPQTGHRRAGHRARRRVHRRPHAPPSPHRRCRPAPAPASASQTVPTAHRGPAAKRRDHSPASRRAGTADEAAGDYTVVRGDTLWDIADEQLDDPTRWTRRSSTPARPSPSPTAGTSTTPT